MLSRISLFKRITAALLISICLQGCPLILIGGTGSIALLIHERRSPGTLADDKDIQIKTYRYLKKNIPKSSNIVAVAYNRRLLLAGEVEDKKTKILAEKISKKLINVREIVNEIEVNTPRSSIERTNDTIITSKVKGHLLKNKFALVNHIKVTTVRGTVYLMGIVTRKEGKTAIEQTRQIHKVKKVVQMLEYQN